MLQRKLNVWRECPTSWRTFDSDLSTELTSSHQSNTRTERSIWRYFVLDVSIKARKWGNLEILIILFCCLLEFLIYLNCFCSIFRTGKFLVRFWFFLLKFETDRGSVDRISLDRISWSKVSNKTGVWSKLCLVTWSKFLLILNYCQSLDRIYLDFSVDRKFQ